MATTAYSCMLKVAMAVLCVVCVLHGVESRLASRVESTPACYMNAWQESENLTCKHPLYTTCRLTNTEYVCCGPDHYCCQYSIMGCCRKTTNVYEILGMVFGSVAWLAILVVLGICVVGNFQKICRRKKVFPFSSGSRD